MSTNVSHLVQTLQSLLVMSLWFVCLGGGVICSLFMVGKLPQDNPLCTIYLTCMSVKIHLSPSQYFLATTSLWLEDNSFYNIPED